MMQCPSCSTPLVSGEARCGGCHALVNPPNQGSSALAPRLVTPQSFEGVGLPPPAGADAPEGLRPPQASKPNPGSVPGSIDDAWRREVLERVRKRRQVRSHAMPLFSDGTGPAPVVESESSAPASLTLPPAAPTFGRPADSPVVEPFGDPMDDLDPRPSEATPDLLASLDLPLSGSAVENAFDLPLRLFEADNPASMRERIPDLPSQTLVERPRPTLVTGPVGARSLVADLPLVEPTRPEAADQTPPMEAAVAISRAAPMSDRVQAALIDLGVWSAMNAVAFYFASRIARTSIPGLAGAWQGLALFALVVASAYILFFGGLSGATPGKFACGIQVRRDDGSPLGPLASLARGLLGIVGIALLGLGIWPAFWDKNRRALHDRATGSRVTTV